MKIINAVGDFVFRHMWLARVSLYTGAIFFGLIVYVSVK